MPARIIDISPPLVNASGIFSYLDLFSRLEREGACLGGFVTKSIGPVERGGNDNPVVFDTGYGLLNSLALPTPPLEQWLEEFATTGIRRPVIVSIFGFSGDDFANLARELDSYALAFELNLSCPNVQPGEQSLMRTLADSPDQVKEVVGAVRGATDKPVIAKLSPNTDYLATAKAAYDAGADYLACSNSLGPGLAVDPGLRRTVLAGGTGGLTGPPLKPVALAMVYKLYELFPVPIIAYGGVQGWRDAIDYFLAGAIIVGLGTCFARKSTSQVVALTQEIWQGVVDYLGGRALSEIIGASHVH